MSAIQTQAFNLHVTALDAVTIRITLIQYRCARGECDLGRVDKTAAVTGDTGRIGGDDLSRLAGDLDPAIEVTGIAAVDFIQDDACTARGQPRIALNPATELGWCVGAAVVENGAISSHIKLAVAVARDTGSAGSLNVDQRDTVAGLQNRGALIDRRGDVGSDLSGGTCQCEQNNKEKSKTEAHRQ